MGEEKPIVCGVCATGKTTKGKKAKLANCMICMRGVHHDCAMAGFSCKGGCDMKEQELNYEKHSQNVVEGDTILKQHEDLKRNLPKYEEIVIEEKRVKLSEAKEKEKGEDDCVKMTYNQEYKGNENFKEKRDSSQRTITQYMNKEKPQVVQSNFKGGDVHATTIPDMYNVEPESEKRPDLTDSDNSSYNSEDESETGSETEKEKRKKKQKKRKENKKVLSLIPLL